MRNRGNFKPCPKCGVYHWTNGGHFCYPWRVVNADDLTGDQHDQDQWITVWYRDAEGAAIKFVEDLDANDSSLTPIMGIAVEPAAGNPNQTGRQYFTVTSELVPQYSADPGLDTERINAYA